MVEIPAEINETESAAPSIHAAAEPSLWTHAIHAVPSSKKPVKNVPIHALNGRLRTATPMRARPTAARAMAMTPLLLLRRKWSLIQTAAPPAMESNPKKTVETNVPQAREEKA